MAKPKRVTHGELRRLLVALGFVEESVEGSHRAFRHADSDTLIVLPDYRDLSEPVRDEDLISVRRHLEERGLAGPRDFAALVPAREPGARSAEGPDSQP